MTLTDRDNRIISLWLAGWKTEAIAAEVGMSEGKVRTRAVRIGLPRQKIRALNLWPAIVAWAKDGHGALEIAQALKCTKPELVAGCGNSAMFQVKQSRKRVAHAIRSRASKRAWETRKRQALVREASSAASETEKDAA